MKQRHTQPASEINRAAVQEGKWRLWLDQYKKILVEIGVPKILFETQERWKDFIQNGAPDQCNPGPAYCWDVERLTDAGAETLMQLLESTIPLEEQCEYGLYLALADRLIRWPAKLSFWSSWCANATNKIAPAHALAQDSWMRILKDCYDEEESWRSVFLGSPASWVCSVWLLPEQTYTKLSDRACRRSSVRWIILQRKLRTAIEYPGYSSIYSNDKYDWESAIKRIEDVFQSDAIPIWWRHK